MVKASERVDNQLVYLAYVLEGGVRQLDAELLRPVLDNLACVSEDPQIPGEAKSLAGDAVALVSRWMQMGNALSLEAMERLQQNLEQLLRVLKRTTSALSPLPPPLNSW